MKQFILLILIALLAAPAGFAQTGKRPRTIIPLIAEEPIRHVIVSGNIDVLLIGDAPQNIGVKLPESSVEKIEIRLDGENLYLSASSKLAPDERASAFITVNDLISLELKGNVVVTSKGVLDFHQLKVITSEKSMVALRSGSPVMVTSPVSYQVVREKGYYAVYAGKL